MDNRVSYLSDKLVHLRGGLKSVDEVMTPAAEPSAAPSASSAEQRRRAETEQLYNDLLQRMTHRKAQLDALQNDLDARLKRAAALSDAVAARISSLPGLRPDDAAVLSASELGKAFRAVDAERLDYFTLDAECERILLNASGSNSGESAPKAEESFSARLRNGWALALSLGVVIALALILAALILFSAWR